MIDKVNGLPPHENPLGASSRIEWIEATRGFAMLLVIFGHSIQFGARGTFDPFTNPVFATIYSFHMPLFIFLSGYLHRKPTNVFQSLTSKFQKLLFPVFSWGLVFATFQSVATLVTAPKVDFLALTRLFIKILQPYDTLWFLWCLFAILVIVDFVALLPPRVVFGALVATTLLLWSVPDIIGYQLKWLFPFFVAGKIIAKLNLTESSSKARWLLLAGTAFLILMCFWEKEDSVYVSGMHLLSQNYFETGLNWTYRYGLAALGIVLSVGLFQRFTKKSQLHRLKKLGGMTLGVYCFQNYLFVAIRQIPSLNQNAVIYCLIYVPLVFSIVTLTSYYLTKCLTRNDGWPRKLFLGKPQRP